MGGDLSRDHREEETAAEMVAAVRAVPWSTLVHAYGPAADVEEQLIAVAVGDEPARKAAWWELWGNVHHQGTIYEATVRAVPILARLAGWRTYPDRVEAIAFLREVAEAEGVVVWAFGAGDEMVFDAERQDALGRELDRTMAAVARSLLGGWRDEPERVRRALLWLLSALPDLHEEFAELVDALLPREHAGAWSILARGPASQEEFDAICRFEEWARSGGA